MSAEDLSLLSAVGQDLRESCVHSFVQALLYGAYLTLQGLTFFSLLYRRKTTPATKALMAMMVVILLSTTLEFCRGFSIVVVNINYILVAKRTAGLSLSDRQKFVSEALRPVTVMSAWTSTVNFLCGDIVVVWRAWVLWPGRDRRWVRFLLLFIIFCDAGLAFCSSVLITRSYTIHDISALDALSGWERRADFGVNTANNFFSLITNVLATGLIAIRAWQHASRMSRLGFGKRGVQSSAGRVLILLVETGFLFCCLQIVYCTLLEVSLPSHDLAADLFNVFTFYIAALYPSLIILILKYERSAIENSVTFCDADSRFDAHVGGHPESGTLSALRFAKGDSQHMTTFDVSMGSRAEPLSCSTAPTDHECGHVREE